MSVLGARAAMRAPLPETRREPFVSPNPSAEARGAAVYRQYGCALCHGERGEGGFSNPNAETASKVPGLVYVAEGYTREELRLKILDGQALIGREDAQGPPPPFRMPGWRGRMAEGDANDLVTYLFSLYPESKEEKWR